MKNMQLTKNTIIIYLILLCFFVTACRASSKNSKPDDASGGSLTSETSKSDDYLASRDIFAMDTYMTVQAYGSNADEAVSQAVDEIKRLDGLLSATADGSEIQKLNSNGGGKVSEDVAYLLGRAAEVYDSTDKRFNVAIYPIVEEWGFASGEYKVPEKEKINDLLKLTDFSKISFDKSKSSVTYEIDGMKIDFGGIAKGYTSARIMDIFMNCGIKSGIVNLGGNVQVLGTKADGSEWRVAIQDPLDEENYIGVLSTHDRAVITSGGYERYFEENGERYHHILNPDTGYPARSGLISVTIVCADGTMADCLSTSLFIMGRDGAIDYWQEHQAEFDTILYTEDGQLLVTQGIATDFKSDLDITIIGGD